MRSVKKKLKIKEINVQRFAVSILVPLYFLASNEMDIYTNIYNIHLPSVYILTCPYNDINLIWNLSTGLV